MNVAGWKPAFSAVIAPSESRIRIHCSGHCAPITHQASVSADSNCQPIHTLILMEMANFGLRGKVSESCTTFSIWLGRCHRPYVVVLYVLLSDYGVQTLPDTVSLAPHPAAYLRKDNLPDQSLRFPNLSIFRIKPDELSSWPLFSFCTSHTLQLLLVPAHSGKYAWRQTDCTQDHGIQRPIYRHSSE